MVGNPVRTIQNKLSVAQARDKIGLHKQQNTILIFGGSQGAHSINKVVSLMLKDLMNRTDVQVIWGTGEADYSSAIESAIDYKERVWVHPYIEDMQTVYQASDIVISRAGAITLSEIQVFGIPAILVPYPYAAGGHQEWNARTLESKGAAKVILDSELTADMLLREIVVLLDDTAKRKKMAEEMSKQARLNATEEIVDSILALATHTNAEASHVGKDS